MIIRKTPKNPMDYCIVDSDINEILYSNGYQPIYMSFDGSRYYYFKTENILDFINKNNLIVLDS